MKKLLAIPLAIIAAILIASAASAASTVVVTPANPQGWSTSDTRPGGAVNFIADATAPGGAGALQLTTDALDNTNQPDNAAKAQYLHAAANVPLSSVTELSYQTKQNAPSASAADPSYQLAVDLDGTPATYTNLVFEPYWNTTGNPANGTWQTWNVAAGNFWSSGTKADPNNAACTVTSGAGGAPFYTLAQLQTACPNAVAVGFGVNIGTYNPGYNVEADLVDFNGTTYDFEQNPPTPTTGTIAVCATDSTGANIVLGGDQAWLNDAYVSYAGPVGDSGCRESTFPAGDAITAYVEKDGISSGQKTVTVVAGQTVRVDFYTTKVTLQYTGGIRYTTGYTYAYNKPSQEMLTDGSPITFLLGNTGSAEAPVDLSWPIPTGTGTTYTATLAVGHVVDSTNTPLAGVSGSAYSGGWFGSGVTDANGNLAFVHSGTAAIGSVAMSYNGSSNQVNQNSTVNSVYDFQTRAVTVQLSDSNGSPLAGGDVYEYPAHWTSPAGTTDANGQVALEMFSGAYSFAMIYNHSRQQMDGVTSDLVAFQTGNVNIHYSGSAEWYSNGYYSLATPQELLPGNLIVYLYGSPLGRCQDTIAVTSGAHLNLSGVVATLSDSANHGAAGGVATAYVGGWQPIGTTDGTGTACALFNGTLGNTAVAMVYNGTRQQISQNQPTNSIYAFQAGTVTVELENSSGALIDTGNASYYAGGWHDLGATSGGKVTTALLPGTYAFAMTYNGTRQQFNYTVSATNHTVVFQTSLVVVELQSHTNSALNIPNNGSASYYAGGWQPITTVNPNNHSMVEAQMLPGTYSFALTCNGTRDQKTVAIPSGATAVYFHAALVTVELQAHDGGALDVGTASYYAGGWHTMVDAQAEMLPGSYSFAATYNGTRDQKTYTVIEPNPNNNANATQSVLFKTGQVHSDGGTATAYYAGGWHTFTNDSELLPGTYTFSFSDRGNLAEPITAGIVNHIH